jgi:hypothetical protein
MLMVANSSSTLADDIFLMLMLALLVHISAQQNQIN